MVLRRRDIMRLLRNLIYSYYIYCISLVKSSGENYQGEIVLVEQVLMVVVELVVKLVALVFQMKTV